MAVRVLLAQQILLRPFNRVGELSREKRLVAFRASQRDNVG
jgi:hypothetical protein